MWVEIVGCSYLAKILAPEGSKDVAVGQHIAITVSCHYVLLSWLISYCCKLTSLYLVTECFWSQVNGNYFKYMVTNASYFTRLKIQMISKLWRLLLLVIQLSKSKNQHSMNQKVKFESRSLVLRRSVHQPSCLFRNMD